jgi:hypothetical protein
MSFHAPLRMRKHSMQLMMLMRPLQALDVMNTVCFEHVVWRLTLPRKRSPSYSLAVRKRQKDNRRDLTSPSWASASTGSAIARTRVVHKSRKVTPGLLQASVWISKVAQKQQIWRKGMRRLICGQECSEDMWWPARILFMRVAESSNKGVHHTQKRHGPKKSSPRAIQVFGNSAGK